MTLNPANNNRNALPGYWRVFGVALVTLLAWSGRAMAADRCEALRTLKVPAVTIVSVANIRKDEPIVMERGGEPVKLGAAACRVSAIARPSADSLIRFEVWIPQGAAWNGKYLQVGNGGFAGQVPLFSILDGVRRGYAVAGTDDGHQTSDSTDAQWALGHPEKIRDFGDRALKATHDAAQRITVAYAGRKPRLAYFAGCSDGGREALMVAQRYPRDFNGVVAGAPAAYWTTLMEGGAALGKRVADPATRIPKSKLQALQGAALAACGGSVSYVADPGSCHFNPDVLLCGAQNNDSCLTAPQVATAHAIYNGPTLATAAASWSGTAPGAEAAAGSWSYWVTGEPGDGLAMPHGIKYAWNYFAYLVRRDPAFRFESLTADDVSRSHAQLGPVLNADNPDLAQFRRHGGRLLQYHGWNDPAIPASHSRAYYNRVVAKLGDASDFYKLYFVPGMLHCGGGPGPGGVDWLRHLEDWVERGQAPGEIVANKSPWDAAPAGASQRLAPFQAR